MINYDKLSVVISAGNPPSWHARIDHDNFGDAFKTLERLSRDNRDVKEIVILVGLGNQYSVSRTTDSYAEAISALGNERAIVQQLQDKPEEPAFKVGDRVEYTGKPITVGQGVVKRLVEQFDETLYRVAWDSAGVSTERSNDLRKVNEQSPKFRVGDRVVSSGVNGKKSQGSIQHTWQQRDFRCQVKWDDGSVSLDISERDLHGTTTPEPRPFKPGDRVRWKSDPEGKATGTVAEPGLAGKGWTTIKWDSGDVTTEITAHIRLECAVEDVIEPGDRVQAAATNIYGTVLKPALNTKAGKLHVRWDTGMHNWSTDPHSVTKQ